MLAQNAGDWQLESKNNGISLQKLISDKPLVCVWAADECGQQNVSKQRKMDRQREGHCCLSIHLRCTWKSSTMTAHPSATGVLLSLLEHSQKPSLSIMHHFSSSLRSHVFVYTFCRIFNVLERGVSFGFAFVSVCVADKWSKLSSNVWKGKKIGYRQRGEAQEMVKVDGETKVRTQGSDKDKSEGSRSETRRRMTIRVCEEHVCVCEGRNGASESKVSSDTAAVDLIPS